MVTQGSSDDLVESMDIPGSMKDLYAKACEEDRIMAMSLSIPANRKSTTMLVQGKGWEVIAKVEELSAVSELCFTSSIIRRLTLYRTTRLARNED